MSLKFRQLSKIKQTGQNVTLRMNDGTTVEGSIIDLDQEDVCILDNEFERTLAINAIIDIQTRTTNDTIFHQLQDALNNQIQISLMLRNGDTISNVEVIDLESKAVLIRNHTQERVVEIDQVTNLVPADSPGKPVINAPMIPPQPDPTPLVAAPPPPQLTVQEVSYPQMRQVASLLEQQLNILSWTVEHFPELIRQSPVSQITEPRLGKVWSRALNYQNDRAWKKAAEEFGRFAAMKLDSYEACHNAAVCWFKLPDYTLATIYFDQSIERQETTSTLQAGIIAANQARYWHKAVDWMFRYLQMTKGSDTRAYHALDFGLKFGLYKTALQSIKAVVDGQFPMDWLWVVHRLAYLAIRYPTLPGGVLIELEQILNSGQVTVNNMPRIVDPLLNIAHDSPSLDYRNAQHLAEKFIQQHPAYNLNRVNELRGEIADLRQRYKFHDAIERVMELLVIIPDDPEAQNILRDLKLRTAPPGKPAKLQSRPPSSQSYYDTFGNAKKAELRGDLEQAIRLYKQCIANKESRWKSAVMDLAGVYLRREEIDEGVNCIRNAQSALDPVASNNMLGALYFKGGKYDAAIQAYRAVEKQKTSQMEKVGPLISIAMIYVRQGDLEAAKKVLHRVLQIQPNQSAAKGLMESIHTGAIQSQLSNFEIDKEGYLNLGRVIGVGTIGIGAFLEAELASTEITGLNREIIVNQRFSLRDVDYLLGRAGGFGKGKPEQVAEHCISAAKVLDILNERGDDRFPESLRRFCAAQADYYAIKNFDVARTYYVESFRLEDTVTTQLRTKFTQLLMTFLCEREEFLKSELAYDTQTLLFQGICVTSDIRIRHGVALSILNVARKNPDILVKLQEHFRQSKIRNGLIKTLADLLGEKNTPNFDHQTLEHLIRLGQQSIEKSERELEERFNYFFQNSENHQLIYDMHQRFDEWQPNFKGAGVDFDGRDAERIEEMKRILRQYVRFVNEDVFEEKDNLRNGVITQIQRLQQDIEQFPTHYARCHMLPILQKWVEVIEAYFTRIASDSKPYLEISDVAKAVYSGPAVTIHVVVSNAQGKSAASGIRIRILPSTSGDYTIGNENYDLPKTLRAGERMTVVVEVSVSKTTPAFTLNYQLSYTDRQGKVTVGPDSNIAVRLPQEKFERIDNPYALWASSNEVTDPKMFYGRDQLVNELKNLFQLPGQRKMVVIHGQKRAGKSSVLYHVKRLIDNQDSQPDGVVVCAFKMSIGDVITSFSLANFFYVLARELYRAAKGKVASLAISQELQRPTLNDFRDDPFNRFLEFTEILLEALESKVDMPINLLMIIDEFTYLYDMIQKGELNQNFMKAWKALVERRLFSFLLCGIDEMPEFVDAYANEFAVADLRRVSYLEPQWSRHLIEDPIRDQQTQTSRFQEIAISRIQELTGNSAYYIQIFNNQLVEYMNEENTGYITEADIDSVARRLTYGRNTLDLAQNFDNLTRFKNNADDTTEVQIEGKLLRLIAFLTKNEEFARQDSILRRFPENEHEVVERLIYRLIDREVLKAQAGSQRYAFVVGIFKEWLNTNLPYEEELGRE